MAPSTTVIDGRLAIRAAIVNHRTEQCDIDRLVSETLRLGLRLAQENEAARPATETTRTPAQTQNLPPRIRWEAELPEVENELAANPESIELRFRRTSLLAELGRLAQARDEYIGVLRREPFHLAAMNNLGHVLIAMGHRKVARMAFHEAVTRHPENLTGRLNYGNFLLEESERLTTHGQDAPALQHKLDAREQFAQALRLQPDCAKAHEGLSYLLADLGEARQAEVHRREAFRQRSVIALPYRGGAEPVSVLMLASTLGGNVRMQRFLDDRIFQTFVVVPEFYDPKVPLPAHNLVINSIGDAEVSHRALHAAPAVLAQTKAPIVNAPGAVLATTRGNNAKRLRDLTGVVTPITATLRRKRLSGSQALKVLSRHGLEFPLLLRAPGFHTGQHFVKVDDSAGLPGALAELPGDELIVMQYLDARGADSKTRKYRVMLVDGRIYPLHLAISSHWKVHYFTAEMNDNAEHRAEDGAFLGNMPGVLGPAAISALERIRDVLKLDYAGIDFGLNAQGEVLVFEANATMAVNPPGADQRWNYRLPAYERIREAVQKMFRDRAGRVL